MLMGSMAGICTKHKMEKMFVGNENATEPTCVKCKAEAEPKTGITQTVEDPGEVFFKTGHSNARVTILRDVPTTTSDKASLGVDTRFSYTMKDVVEAAVTQLRKLPMPEDIKEFKRVQKVIKTLQSLVESQNG